MGVGILFLCVYLKMSIVKTWDNEMGGKKVIGLKKLYLQ